MDEKQFKELEKQIGVSMAAMVSEKTDEMRAGLLTEDQLKTERVEIKESKAEMSTKNNTKQSGLSQFISKGENK